MKPFIRAVRLRLAVLILALAAAFSLAVPGTANASAYGCSFGDPNWGPSYYCVYLQGSGNYVNYVSGTWRGSAQINGAYITAEFFDASWHWYQTLYSGTQWGWETGSGAAIGVYSWKYTGYMCSTLHYYDGYWRARAMSVCHRIG